VPDLRAGSFEHADASNEGIAAQTRLFSKGMVIGGKWWLEASAG
jgi:hypothetical protein